MTDPDLLVEKIRTAKRELRDEYLQPHDKPWIIGFSGGKDSTLLAHLVVETLLSVAPDQRARPVYIVCNDTLVESPLFRSFVEKMLVRIEENIEALNVPVQVVRTHPLPEESFWVNMLGKGYPAPNRTFRWFSEWAAQAREMQARFKRNMCGQRRRAQTRRKTWPMWFGHSGCR